MKNAHQTATRSAHHADQGHNKATESNHASHNSYSNNTDAAVPVSNASYSEADLAQVLFMIEEEKLAGDVYDALFAQTGLSVFDRIGDAEDRHMDTLLDQAATLGLNVDTIISLPEGTYSSPELQALYNTLMAAGSVSTTAALEVGAAIENADIADLELAMAGLVDTPLGDVYANLLSGSNQHLTAFENLLA